MNTLTTINDIQVSIITYNSVPVITSAMLADFYTTDTDNIKQNHIRNKSRFFEDKHYFKIIGEELRSFVSDLK